MIKRADAKSGPGVVIRCFVVIEIDRGRNRFGRPVFAQPARWSVGETTGEAVDAARGGPAARFDRAREWILAHIGDPGLSAAGIAEALCMSRRSLFLLFRRHGTTPAATIREIRLSCCKAALEGPRQGSKMTPIALDHGFRDYATFSRLFKRRYGRCPGEYRREFADRPVRTERRPFPGETHLHG